jgi:hypothetical protein
LVINITVLTSSRRCLTTLLLTLCLKLTNSTSFPFATTLVSWILTEIQ